MNKKFVALFLITIALTNSVLSRPHSPESFTHFHLAAWYSDVTTIHNLCSLGYSSDAQDEFDWTALHIAAAWGHFACVKALVENGANIFLETNNHQIAEELAWSFRTIAPGSQHEKIWFYLKTEREKYERLAHQMELEKMREMKRAQKKELKKMRQHQKNLERTLATEAMDCE